MALEMIHIDYVKRWQKKSIISENFIQGIFIIFITAAQFDTG